MAREGAVQISVEGLDELRRDLKAAGDKNLSRKLRARLKKAAEVVAADARSRVPVGPDVGGHATDHIKAGSTTTSAFVIGGKADNPYYAWLDFGSRTPNGGKFTRGRIGQTAAARAAAGVRVGPWANSGAGPKGGRFIYPSIEANSDELIEQVTAAVDEAFKEEDL